MQLEDLIAFVYENLQSAVALRPAFQVEWAAGIVVEMNRVVDDEVKRKEGAVVPEVRNYLITFENIEK